MLRRRLDETARPPAPDPLTGPSYEELRIREAVLAYVVGEGHHDETISRLPTSSRRAPAAISSSGPCAIWSARGRLTIDGGKIVPGRAWLTDPLIP